MKTISLLLGMLLGCGLCQAKPEKPWRVKHPPIVWWLGEAVIIGVEVVDSRSTLAARKNCPACSESSLLLSAHPSTGAVVGVAVLAAGAQTTFHMLSHWVLRNDTPAWRLISDTAIPAEDAAIVLPGAIHNYRLRSPCAGTTLRCQ